MARNETKLKWYPEKLLKTLDRRTSFLADDIALEAVSKAKEMVPVKTGALQASIQADVSKHNEELKEAVIFSDKEYAASIEFGSRNNAPQPFLQPALDSVKNKIRSMIDKAKTV